MPIIKSAKKRVRVAHKATVRNAKTKRSLKEALKAFQKSTSTDKKNASENLRQAQSTLGKAGKKHVMHKNKVARKQRQLAAAAKAAGVTVAVASTKKASAKPATAKASTTKKSTSAKKPATKKAATKK